MDNLCRILDGLRIGGIKEKIMNKFSLKKRILIGFVSLLLIIVVVLRLYLSAWVLDYVNGVLAGIPGYKGSVESINIDLYRGAYRINNLKLDKDTGKIPTPFLDIHVIDLSLQWSSLLHGRIVSSITLMHPVINFAVSKDDKQTGENVDWTKPIKDLAPIDINFVRFQDGSVTYQDFSSTPQVNIYIHQMDGRIDNLRNVEKGGDALPSTVAVRGNSIGSGSLKINGHMNILKQVPDMDLLLALENVNLPALNSYTEAYAAFDFKQGTFNLYSHMVTKNGQVGGYIKPVVTNLSVNVLKKANPVEVVWSSVVAGVLGIFTNISKDQFATRINLEGSVDKIDTNVWSALVGIFENAFINAMSKGFDQTGEQEIIEQQK
jgi:hypothetical protein